MVGVGWRGLGLSEGVGAVEVVGRGEWGRCEKIKLKKNMTIE